MKADPKVASLVDQLEHDTPSIHLMIRTGYYLELDNEYMHRVQARQFLPQQ